MAVPWMENTTGLLSVQMATLLPEEADREVIMDLGLRDEVSNTQSYMSSC